MGRVLVTGGAGYIGSHAVRALLDRGDEVLVFDALTTGHRAAVDRRADFVQGDVRDGAALRRALEAGPIDACLHFAALALVGESMREPERYFDVNVGGTATLLAALESAGVRALVLSSTAAVYGDEARSPITEDVPRAPCNPYGESKAAAEDLLFASPTVRCVALRYFNAAGGRADGALGEDHDPETHLVPLALDAALGRRGALTVFGTDWPTPDGTCVRDYIHVEDLVNAHLLALRFLGEGVGSMAFNLGTGRGSSVREVLGAVGEAVGRPVPSVNGERRPGDPAVLVASAERARHVLGWAPTRGLDAMVRHALAFRRRHPTGHRR